MAKFKFVVGLGYVGCDKEEIIEIPDDALDKLNKDEKRTLINEWYEEWIWEMIDDNSYWKELEEG